MSRAEKQIVVKVMLQKVNEKMEREANINIFMGLKNTAQMFKKTITRLGR